jgi:hypothetical protein
MQGPARIIRSIRIANYKNLGPLFKWTDGRAYLIIDKVAFGEKAAAILCYHNPPVHQIGTTGLYAFHEGLDVVFETFFPGFPARGVLRSGAPFFSPWMAEASLTGRSNRVMHIAVYALGSP